MQTRFVNRFLGFTISSLFFGLSVFPVQAAFTSLRVFGDGVCTSTNNTTGLPYYYGQRFTNGRVWPEVLAQRQGIAYDPNKNWSYFGNTSTNLVGTLASYPAPADAATALFVVWVNDADLYYETLYDGTNLTKWVNARNQSLSNHVNIIQALYNKGARTLVMPNAVDISKIPIFNGYAQTNFITERCEDYNLGFAAMVDQARTLCPNLTIFVPDIFGLVEEIFAHPSVYGLTNALADGLITDALDDPANSDYSLNGAGAAYIFWDDTNPTARVHALIADRAQQLISPVRISGITAVSGSNRLDLVNLPIGRNGFAQSCTNFTSWTPAQSITSSNAVQSVFLPVSGPLQFYRLSFPFAWTWP